MSMNSWSVMDCSLPGSFLSGIFQARILEWVAISYAGKLPNTGIESASLGLQNWHGFSTMDPPGKPWIKVYHEGNVYGTLRQSNRIKLL